MCVSFGLLLRVNTFASAEFRRGRVLRAVKKDGKPWNSGLCIICGQKSTASEEV